MTFSVKTVASILRLPQRPTTLSIACADHDRRTLDPVHGEPEKLAVV